MKRRAKGVKRAYTAIPKWVTAIPLGTHGSGKLQRRLWKLVSDAVRISDWYTYFGKCVATGEYIPHWSQGHAGHFKNFASCRGMFKFNRANVHLQSAHNNYNQTTDSILAFEKELKRRYGEDYIETLHKMNLKTELPISTADVLKEIEKTLEFIGTLPEQPAYYQRVMEQQMLGRKLEAIKNLK
jgi:hypothetical protein